MGIKRRDLIKQLEVAGYKSVRDTGSHEIYSNGTHTEPIPRHREINENTAKAILKRMGA